MGERMESNQETYKTEYEIIDLVRLRLYQKSHALAVILGSLEMVVGDFEGNYRIDGKRLFLDAARLRREFLEEMDWICQEVLHMMSHCLLGHPFFRQPELKSQEALRQYHTELDQEAWELAERLWGEKLEEQLLVDNHDQWQSIQQRRQLAKASGDNGNGHVWWQQQREKLQKEIRGKRRRKAGTTKQSRVQRLVPAAGHRGDYREVLQSFSSFREDSRINPDEFQYAWYTYGLETYGNMPLIEPLEYREERKIEDLVIVIDTSGSCERDLVRIFLEETKGILEQEQLFFRKFCLHIIQCDNRIQRDDRITTQEEFEIYLENLTIVGGGGTDFRPAFERIGELEAAGEFRDLQGILYFTDGSGLYPKDEPDYAVWFVMLKNHYDAIDMPDWIHRLVLEERTVL